MARLLGTKQLQKNGRMFNTQEACIDWDLAGDMDRSRKCEKRKLTSCFVGEIPL